MTLHDLASEIRQLSVNERLELIEILTQSVRDDLNTERHAAPDSSLNRVLGMLKPDGTNPTDEELRQDYIRFLNEKYS